MGKLNKTVKYLRESSQKDLKTAEYLFKGKKYDACLFFCHLSLEKLLKGIFVEKFDASPPFIHSLTRLAELVGLDLNLKEIADTVEITKFNIAGRYEDAKFQFYKKCTYNFTIKWFKKTQEYFLQWEKHYQKK